MPQYPFACGACGAEFDVDRAEGDLVRPVACPVDGAPARRVYDVSPADTGKRAELAPAFAAMVPASTADMCVRGW